FSRASRLSISPSQTTCIPSLLSPAPGLKNCERPPVPPSTACGGAVSGQTTTTTTTTRDRETPEKIAAGGLRRGHLIPLVE
ncbi:unnamed protein product, partial [Caenorhabditis auriculariae]